MAVADRRTKDQAMAGAMKQAGIERERGRCCVCYRMVAVSRPQTPFAIYPHPALCRSDTTHKKPYERKGRK